MSAPSRAEIVACETCGSAQRDAAGRTRGEGLIAELRAALASCSDLPVDVSSVRCLWACKKSCAVAVRSVSRVGYVLAELEPTELVARALLDYAARYARSEDGAVPYREWPLALKGHFLCRFPKGADLQSGDSPGPDSAGPDSVSSDSVSSDSAGLVSVRIDIGPQNPDELTRAVGSLAAPGSTGTIAMNKLPTTIVTGFLGSGKTTLLRHLLTQANGRRLAVIVNEFGEVGVDGELLRQCGVGCDEDPDAPTPLYELANGCLCCTVQEEFVPVLETLVERRDRIDHILIETSGLALPKPLVQAFQWPEIRANCTVDAVVALVDGPAVLSGQFAADPAAVDEKRREDPNLDHDRPLRELFEDQLAAADLVIVSKVDELGPGDFERVRELIAGLTPPSVKVIAAERGVLPFDVVLGLQRAAEDAIDARHTHHDDDHEEGKEHSHELFDTIVVRPPVLERAALLRGLEAVVREHEVYRAKGFAAIEGKPMRLVVQGVGRRFDSYFDRAWGGNEQRATELVFIGSHLDREQLTRTLLGAAGA